MTSRFAFTSGLLSRSAHLRSDEHNSGIEEARTLVFWRGKLLVDLEGGPILSEMGIPAMDDAPEPPIFLGLADGTPRYAVDLTAWKPIEDAATIGEFIDHSQQPHSGWPDAVFAEVRGMMSSLSQLDAECVATGRALTGWHATHRFCSNCGSPTKSESSGWVRKCPKCATQHFPRTDPVVIMAITFGDELLLGRSPGWPETMYSLLAGFIEPGETIESAVRREVLEESGVQVGRVGYIASQPWPFPMSLMFGCHGEASTREIVLDKFELADARWFGRAEVASILTGAHGHITRPRKGAIAGAIIEAWVSGNMLDRGYWAVD